MRIANPLYDVVIKYLLEDLEIAKGFISALIKVAILSLEIKPQEVIIQKDDVLHLMRIDFKAILTDENNKKRKALIEIQKSKSGFQLNRFRKYLGVNYLTQDDIPTLKGSKKADLPIFAIYIVGFEIAGLKAPIVRVKRQFIDEITGQSLEKTHKYIEALSHDCLIIQIPRLKNMVLNSELEQVLDVFNEEKYKTDDKHILDYSGKTDNPLVKKMVNRLRMAMADEQLLLQMYFEDEIQQAQADNEEKIKDITTKLKKFIKKTQEADIAKEEALKKEKEAILAKEEALKDKEEERKAKEEALKMKEEERKAKEEERKAKEIALQEIELLKKQLAEILNKK